MVEMDARPAQCATFLMCMIEFSYFSSSQISEIVAPLQEGNLSIADISDHTGFKKTTIWEAQKLQKRPATKLS